MSLLECPGLSSFSIQFCVGLGIPPGIFLPILVRLWRLRVHPVSPPSSGSNDFSSHNLPCLSNLWPSWVVDFWRIGVDISLLLNFLIQAHHDLVMSRHCYSRNIFCI